MKNKAKLCFAAMILMSACAKEQTFVTEEPVEITGVTITAAPFLYDTPQTKTYFEVTEHGAEFKWRESDIVGIFPTTGTQVRFPMTNGAGASTAKFDGGGWAVKGSYSYMAYYPFIADMNMDKAAIPAHYRGQKQRGNNNLSHLGDFDYMAAVKTTPSGDGNVGFSFNHLAAIVRLTLVVPKPGTYNSLTLEATGASFTTDGIIDITQNAIAVTPTETAAEFSIELEDITTSTPNETIVIYLMLPPVNLLSCDTYAVLRGQKSEFRSKIERKNYEQGKIYAPKADEMTGDNVVKLRSGEDFNSAIKSLANKYYYITEKTDYKIKHIVFVPSSDYTPKVGDIYTDVSAISSTTPIYAVWDEAAGTMTIHSPLSKIYTEANCQAMFYNLAELEDIDFCGFDTWYAENMHMMFKDCHSLTSLDVSGFNVSNTDIFVSMFSGCSALKTLDLSSFIKAGDMQIDNMFQNCSSLTSLDISGLEPRMEDCCSVFAGCTNLAAIDVSKWDTSNCTNANGMRDLFSGCSSLTTLDISNFDMTKVTNLMEMFSGCSNLISLNLGNFETNSATDMYGLFQGCSSLTSIDLGNICTENVTNFHLMFQGCEKLESIDVSRFNTSKAQDMFSMFAECYSLKTIKGIEGFDTSNVTTMWTMFGNCHSLGNLDLSGFDTGKCTTLGGMFVNCSSMTSIDISSFVTDHVINMERLFSGCSKLSSLNLGASFNTVYAESLSQMFMDCASLTSLDLSGFDTRDVKDFSSMFKGCTSLENLDISSFSFMHAEKWGSILYDCTKMKNLNLGSKIGDNWEYWDVYHLANVSQNCAIHCSPAAMNNLLTISCIADNKAWFSFYDADSGISMPIPAP